MLKDEENEKAKIQNDLAVLTKRLSTVNDSIAKKITSRNEYVHMRARVLTHTCAPFPEQKLTEPNQPNPTITTDTTKPFKRRRLLTRKFLRARRHFSPCSRERVCRLRKRLR